MHVCGGYVIHVRIYACVFVEGYGSMYMYVCICVSTLDCLNYRQVYTFDRGCVCTFCIIVYIHVYIHALC